MPADSTDYSGITRHAIERLMHFLIVNWAGGENDPFSHLSRQFRRALETCGHDVEIINLDGQAAESIASQHLQHPIDLAFCWQGLGSRLGPDGTPQTIWDSLGIPLVCMHADHPAYMPANHACDSAYHLHVYSYPAFLVDANRLINRRWPAIFLDFPNIFASPTEPFTFHGDYFVFPKNLTDMELVRREWQRHCDRQTWEFLSDMAETIAAAYRNGNRVSHQEVIWNHLPFPLASAGMTSPIDPLGADVIFRLMRELDRVHRNVAAAFVLDVLSDVPIQVVGRGWDRFKARRNPHHQFFPFDRVDDGATQFRSNYGILDIAPSCEALHDRCSRAMRSGTGFLISSSWKAGHPIHEEFSDLFFDGNPDTLVSRVAAVRADPAHHRARVGAFSAAYDALIPFRGFLDAILFHLRARGVMASTG